MNTARANDWSPPATHERIRVIDAHTAGEPLRVFISGLPELAGNSVLARRKSAREQADRFRTALMWEPRGHSDMYGCWIGPPERATSHFSVLFLHNEGYSTMCGHGIIGVVTVAIETGMLTDESLILGDEIHIDTPAGLVRARASCVRRSDDSIRVEHVSFRNVASFVEASGRVVETPGVGPTSYDIAFGGAYYAFVDASSIGLSCRPEHATDLIQAGRAIKTAVNQDYSLTRSDEPDLAFLYGVIFTAPPEDPANHSRHVCIFADGELDRSPTGTGVSARAAILADNDELEPETPIRIESILGTTFDVQYAPAAEHGEPRGVVPVVTGNAFITGRSEFFLDPDDPLRDGFNLR